MNSWKQVLAKSTAVIPGVNDVSVRFNWNIKTPDNLCSPFFLDDVEVYSSMINVAMDRKQSDYSHGAGYSLDTLSVKISYLAFMEAVPAEVKQLRSMEDNFSIVNGVDTLTLGGKSFTISSVTAQGYLNDSNGVATPAVLSFSLNI